MLLLNSIVVIGTKLLRKLSALEIELLKVNPINTFLTPCVFLLLLIQNGLESNVTDKSTAYFEIIKT